MENQKLTEAQEAAARMKAAFAGKKGAKLAGKLFIELKIYLCRWTTCRPEEEGLNQQG